MNRTPLVVPRRSPRLRATAAAVAACAVCAGSAVALAAPATAAPRTVTASPGGGLDPDSSQRATSMLPAGAPDAPSATSGGVTAHVAPSAMQAWNSSDLSGVDVASYQHPNGAAIDWNAVAGSGVSFAFVKATESTGYTNPYYVQDVRGARAAGIQVGAYHFARPAYSATAQADAFAAAMGKATPSLAPVLDLEDNGGLSVSALQSWVAAFLQRTESDTGVRPVIYTGPSFWSTSMGGSTAFTRYPLWVAHYTSSAAPYSVGGWSQWTFWQWSDGSTPAASSVPGISGDVDHNRFQGGSADLAAFAQGNAAYWVRAAALAVLGRPFASADVANFAAPIVAGIATEYSTATNLLESTEALNRDVMTDYQTYLGRSAGAPELSGWVDARRQGLGKSGEVAAMLGSAEFFVDSGATAPTFVQALYSKALGRNASPAEIAYWTPKVQSQGTGAVATAIGASVEATRRLENGAYVAILGRQGDASGLAASPASLGAAWSWELYQAGMYASPEYNANRIG